MRGRERRRRRRESDPGPSRTGPAPGPQKRRTGERGQLVLVAAGVVAVALLAMLLAFAAADAGRGTAAGTGPAVRDADAVDGERVRLALERSVRNATRSVPGDDRDDEAAVREHVRRTVAGDVDRLRGEWAERGAAVSVTRNATAATQWAGASCPTGLNRQFGPCTPADGLVTQVRAGERYVVAVAVDLRVTTDRREVALTVVVRPGGGVVGG